MGLSVNANGDECEQASAVLVGHFGPKFLTQPHDLAPVAQALPREPDSLIRASDIAANSIPALSGSVTAPAMLKKRRTVAPCWQRPSFSSSTEFAKPPGPNVRAVASRMRMVPRRGWPGFPGGRFQNPPVNLPYRSARALECPCVSAIATLHGQ